MLNYVNMNKILLLISTILVITTRAIQAQDCNLTPYAGTVASNTPDGNDSFAVGAIPYEYAVSKSGAALYIVPIDCPKGINGMEPKISLVYNSQAGDGIMGWGWSIGGLSAITRVNKNQHFDGKTESISFTSDDALAIDGQRLLKYANEDGGIWYKTESDNFNKIVAYDIQPWGPKYFKVYTKDGYTMTYGSETGDVSGYYMLHKESDYIYNVAWYLTEVVDLHGNQVLYKYSSQQKLTYYKNHHLSQIVYGKNKNTKSGFETIISFQYKEGISDPVPVYINGKKTLRGAYLSSVTIINGGAVKSTYSIKYNTSENKKLVKEIGYEKNGVKVGSTKFDWSKTQYAHSYKGTLQLPIEKSEKIKGFNYNRVSIISRMFGDIDGDGLSDLFLLCQFRGANQSKYVCMLLHNTGSVYDIAKEIVFDSTTDIATYYFYDDNKDGTEEFFMAYKRNGAFDIHKFEWDERFGIVSEMLKVRHNGDIRSSSPIVGDFYGNGSIQFITKSEKTNGSSVIETAFVNTENAPSVRYLPTIGGRCKILVTDVNGNGKSDITIVSGDAVSVFEESDGFFIPIQFDKSAPISMSVQSLMSFKEIGIGINDNIYQGDFNGDGNTDLLVCKSKNKEWLMYISNGEEYVKFEVAIPLLNNCRYHERVYVADVNNDGRSDLIVKEDLCDSCIDFYYELADGTVVLPYQVLQKRGRVLISTGTNFEEALVFNPDNFESANLSGFISSKEQEEYIGYCNKTSNNLGRHTFSNSKHAGKIISATNGMGETLKLSYGSIGDRSMDTPTYQLGSKDAGDISVLNRCQWNVVTSARLQSNGKTLSSYEYNFSDACFDKKGKGFIGYRKTSIKNYTDSTTTITEYDLNKQYKFTYPVRQTVTSNGKIIKETNNTYECKATVNQGYCLLPKKITETDNLTGLQTITSYLGYDSYGNVLKKKIKKGNQATSEYKNYSQSGSWCPSRPNYIETSYVCKGNTESKHHYISYDKKGNLTSDYDNHTTKSFLDYDVFGNPQTIRVSAGNTKRTEHYTYTLSGRYVKTKTNLLGETTTYDWNESDGTLTSETDAYGRTTKYRYNGLGKRIETIYPDGRRSVSSLLWAENGNDLGASYYQYSETSGQSPEYIWYTSDGKEVCKQSYGYGGKLISVFTEYNNDGTVHRVSEPTFSSNAENWETEYIYDNYQRPIKISKPDGVTTIQYNGRTTVTTSPTAITEQTITAEGWKESVVTNGKRVNYTYYPTGLVKTATPEGGKTITLEYDQQGNRTKLIDPDAGTVLDSYNAFGDILSSERTISDGRRVKTTYTYNDNGLLVQKNIGGDIIRYEYDGSNRLQRKDYGAVHSVEYKYDGFDRVIETKEIIEGNEHLFKTKYDFYGRVTEEKFPTNYAVTNHYDDYGYLTSQSDNQGNNIYEVQSVDAKGRILSERRNNKVTEYSYDAKNNLTDIHANDVLELQYKYRRDNNLPSSVCDRIAGYRQEYYYDSQSRLKSWPIFTATGGTPIQTNFLKYDDNNNIISRSVFGDCAIEYKNDDHPHAVSAIAGVPDVMPKTDLNVSYTNFSKVEQIDEGANHYTIVYGVDQNRVKSILKTAAGETTRYYLPNYEEVTNPLGTTDKIHYLCGGAVMVESGGRWNLYYRYFDRLGSIVAVTDKEGNVAERYAYTPWGERRNPKDWTKPDSRTSFFNNRGFTGHEHLDAFSLIDMGGRVYDPMLGSFLSIDPYIQAPDNWLNYNRYLYCYGNPQIYTDPSGEFITALIIGVAVGVTLGTLSGVIAGRCNGATGWDLVKYGLVGALAGGVSGAVGVGVSVIVGMTALSGTVLGGAVIGASAGLTNGLISGYGFARLGGSSVGQSLLSGLKSGAIGLASGAIIGGTVQGISNVYHGRNFWTGKPSVSAASVANSASSTANQPADMTLDEFASQYGSNKKVIGHYPEYVEMSKELNVKPFSVPDKYWNRMTPTEQWAANQKFLERAIKKGADFILATPPDKVRLGSFLEKEINFLLHNGYIFDSKNNLFYLP